MCCQAVLEMNPDGTSVVTPVQRTSMTVQLQQPDNPLSTAQAVRQHVGL